MRRDRGFTLLEVMIAVAISAIAIVGLLEPSMRPGRLFVVQSRQFNGVYIARDVTFVGDSGWDVAYYVQVRGRPRG